MKRNLLVLGLLASAMCGSAYAQSKINGAGRLMLDAYQIQASSRKAPAKDTVKTMLVTLNEGASTEAIEALGVEIYSNLGEVLIVGCPLGLTEELAALDEVKAIEFGNKSKVYMDIARETTGVDGIHAGTAEGTGGISYTGKGVAVGLFDTGLDPNHAAFRNADGSSRVNAIYVTRDGNKDEEYTTPEAVAAFDTEDNTATHGTHVLGIIAGSRDVQGRYTQYGKSGVQTGTIPYYGAAPEADIIVGCGDFYDEEILRGVDKVVKRAKELGKPAVVNLSLGSNVGPHDPNSATSKTLDALSKDAIICISAGNEGTSNIAVSRTFARVTTLNTFISPVNMESAAVLYNAEFWGSNNEPFELDLVLYNKTSGKIIASHTINNLEGRSYIWNSASCPEMKSYFSTGAQVYVTSNIDPNTNRYYVRMQNDLQYSGSAVKFGVNIRGKAGNSLNGYVSALGVGYYSQDNVQFASEGITGYLGGTPDGSINEMATAKNVIAVGAYVSRATSTPFINGQAYSGGGTRGDIADFSSYGTTADGRDLPVICGPGAQIVSAVNRYYTGYSSAYTSEAIPAVSNSFSRISPYYPMQGTSMSSPFVAGTVALWLEAFPEMTSQQCIDIMTRTAIKDNYTNTTDVLKRRRWGNGKIDPVAGLIEAIREHASIGSVTADETGKNLFIQSLGGRNYEICYAGANSMSVDVYNVQGGKVMSLSSDNDTVELNGESLAKGIYVVAVTTEGGTVSRKLAL